jgi:membrane protease YdiL (CAAX protease family)
LFAAVTVVAACVNPPPPAPPRPPAPDRFHKIAAQDPIARSEATVELSFDPTPDAVRMLLLVLERDVDPRVRGAAASAIAERRDPSLEPALERAAAIDPDPQTRLLAARGRRQLTAWRKRPGAAAGLSLLCPGCGHFYQGKHAEGAALLGSTGALLGGAYGLIRGHELRLDGTADSAKVPIGVVLAATAQNLWFFSIFDAYRKARVARDDLGYRHKISRESLPELVSAPFRPSVLKSPWVWAGVPLALLGGALASYLVDRESLEDQPTIFDVKRVNVLGKNLSRGVGYAAGSAYYGSLFTSVGVGEEALFRGVIQTEMEERFGATGGLLISSAIFGAVHAFNFLDDPGTIAVAVPVITVLGSGLGLAYQKTGYQLSTSVAMHFWYDTLLSMMAFAADPTHQPFVVTYGSSM